MDAVRNLIFSSVFKNGAYFIHKSNLFKVNFSGENAACDQLIQCDAAKFLTCNLKTNKCICQYNYYLNATNNCGKPVFLL